MKPFEPLDVSSYGVLRREPNAATMRIALCHPLCEGPPHVQMEDDRSQTSAWPPADVTAALCLRSRQFLPTVES